MQHMHSVLSTTVTTTGLFAAHDLIGFTGARITAADAPVLGAAHHPSTEIGQQIAVMAIGIVRVKAVGAITAGSKLVTAAAGGVQAATGTPANVFASALTSAADGEFVDILIR